MTDRTPCIFCGQPPTADSHEPFHSTDPRWYFTCSNTKPIFHQLHAESASTPAEAGRLWDRLMRLGRVRR